MNERPATERKTAEVWQTGYGCGHAVRSATNAELKAAGYTHIRITGFLDVDGPCPACKEKRAATRTAQRRRLLAEQEQAPFVPDYAALDVDDEEVDFR